MKNFVAAACVAFSLLGCGTFSAKPDRRSRRRPQNRPLNRRESPSESGR